MEERTIWLLGAVILFLVIFAAVLGFGSKVIGLLKVI